MIAFSALFPESEISVVRKHNYMLAYLFMAQLISFVLSLQEIYVTEQNLDG
jgi:hypothetical protein